MGRIVSARFAVVLCVSVTRRQSVLAHAARSGCRCSRRKDAAIVRRPCWVSTPRSSSPPTSAAWRRAHCARPGAPRSLAAAGPVACLPRLLPAHRVCHARGLPAGVSRAVGGAPPGGFRQPGIVPVLLRPEPGAQRAAPGQDHRHPGDLGLGRAVGVPSPVRRDIDATGSFDVGLAIIGWLPLASWIVLWRFWPGSRDSVKHPVGGATS